MQIDKVIAELRARCLTFAGRVAGAAEYKNLVQNANLAVPAAFVIPLDDDAGEMTSGSGYRQDITDGFAVVVALSNLADERGQAGANQVHDLRAELFSCLLGWEPDEQYGPVIYQGGQLLGVDRARLWWQYEFAARWQIAAEDTRLQINADAAPAFAGITGGVDFINPGPPGPDGNIEIQFTLDPPPA